MFREKMSSVITRVCTNQQSQFRPFLFLVNRCENVTKTVDLIQPYFSHPCRFSIGPGQLSGGQNETLKNNNKKQHPPLNNTGGQRNGGRTLTPLIIRTRTEKKTTPLGTNRPLSNRVQSQLFFGGWPKKKFQLFFLCKKGSVFCSNLEMT